jgi:hypothetical protein
MGLLVRLAKAALEPLDRDKVGAIHRRLRARRGEMIVVFVKRAAITLKERDRRVDTGVLLIATPDEA